jgi:hypothetical protein
MNKEITIRYEPSSQIKGDQTIRVREDGEVVVETKIYDGVYYVDTKTEIVEGDGLKKVVKDLIRGFSYY